MKQMIRKSKNVVTLILMLAIPISGASSTSNTSFFRDKYRAGDLVGLRIELIAKSGTAKLLASNLKNFKILEAYRRICQQELNNKSLPFRCYQLLRLERSFNLIGSDEFKLATSHLDQICESVPNTSNLQPSSEQDLNAMQIESQRCKKVIKILAKKQNYQLEERAPEMIFDRRLERRLEKKTPIPSVSANHYQF